MCEHDGLSVMNAIDPGPHKGDWTGDARARGHLPGEEDQIEVAAVPVAEDHAHRIIVRVLETGGEDIVLPEVRTELNMVVQWVGLGTVLPNAPFIAAVVAGIAAFQGTTAVISEGEDAAIEGRCPGVKTIGPLPAVGADETWGIGVEGIADDKCTCNLWRATHHDQCEHETD